MRAYLAAAEDGAPVADQLRGNAVALWEILGAAVAKAPTGSESLPAPAPGRTPGPPPSRPVLRSAP
ncbi:hypothetical protein [Kitasatospora fiedleri]|uniref:hypothetical protein n=1 Tax=Kitasatospora fiedleri TaxID=2991545 RepID=UPI00249C20B1|nr:hypothetical protein [Kitasatospora fiedleri]